LGFMEQNNTVSGRRRRIGDLGIVLPPGDRAAFEAAADVLESLDARLAAFTPPPSPDRPLFLDGARLDGNPPLAVQMQRIREQAPALNCFTRILEDRAAQTPNPGPLAGATFAVKDLFDVAGLPTTAGSATLSDAAPARRDAPVVARLVQAGAVLTATCNMDEFAYGFVTVNAHHGTTRNPHDLDRIAGGSSGGSAAAVAARLVRFALGSDTNGSIRIPAALCGIYGLRPTHGALPLEGVYPFVESLDVAGPFATTVRDLQGVYEVMRGAPVADTDPHGLRVARLDGWFRTNADKALLDGIDAIAAHLDAMGMRSWPYPELARSAAFVLTAAEGGARHLAALRDRPEALDPATRARLAAGAALPAGAVVATQRFRDWFDGAMRCLWRDVDVLIAPSAPCTAPRLDQDQIELNGSLVSARANLGLFTQPISLAGCPVLAAPLKRPGLLPLGIQLIAAPGREDSLFALARHLETEGLIGADAPGAS